MPSGVFEITDIPADKVDTVIADFNLENPRPQIKKAQQSSGRWTFTATFPGPGEKRVRFGE